MILRTASLLIFIAWASFPQAPAPGSRIPEFRLPDQNGVVQTFESIRGPKGAMLVFYRSADWCAYCKSQLIEMEDSRQELTRLGLGIAAILQNGGWFDEPHTLSTQTFIICYAAGGLGAIVSVLMRVLMAVRMIVFVMMTVLVALQERGFDVQDAIEVEGLRRRYSADSKVAFYCPNRV